MITQREVTSKGKGLFTSHAWTERKIQREKRELAKMEAGSVRREAKRVARQLAHEELLKKQHERILSRPKNEPVTA